MLNEKVEATLPHHPIIPTALYPNRPLAIIIYFNSSRGTMQSIIYFRSSSSTTTPTSSCSTLNTPTESPLGSQFIPRFLSKASSSSSSLLKRERHPGKKTTSYPFPSVNAQSSRAPSFVSRTSVCDCDEPITYINAVTFDGGGVRGAASAKIIDIIMNDLSHATGSEVHPADYFDMFGGTSTGGLIAIMLGRLCVGTKNLLDTYFDLSSRLFKSRSKIVRSLFRGTKYSGKLAEKLFAEIAANNSAEGADATLKNSEFGAPDVFVTAVDAENASGDPIVLRSYDVGSESEAPFAHRIVDAARATTAAPAYFSAKTLGNGKVAIDGGLSVNNPTDVLISEARRKYGRGVRFGLLLSIGTGEKSPTALPACSSAASLLSFTKALGHIVTDSERTHLRVEERFKENDLGTYLRINVPVIGDVHLDDYKTIPEIVDAAEHFMGTPEMIEIRRQIVELLLRSP
ncbi:phospholipase [Sanghuangporus baumii]|uniref:Phospholipase n=1 Tax=Sanghuangporus baumii TaxID=108892 RepID=A0A9Q5HVM7_SANBA|nr:phospholipase [Sanghuangporus baumii]